MNLEIKIREAKERDLIRISEIYREVFLEPPYNENWSKEKALEKIKNFFESTNILIAEKMGEIVGFIIFYSTIWEEGKRGEIIDFGVDKKFRKEGIGNLLLKRVEDLLKKSEADFVVLGVNKNASALNFYKRRGYKEDDFIELKKDLKGENET